MNLFCRLRRWIMAQTDFEKSDFGRRYGWDALVEGEIVAELEYIAWHPEGQFWHSYRIAWSPEKEPLNFPAEDWSMRGVVLRNKKHTDVLISNYLSSGKEDIIYLRGVYVPRE